MSYTGKTWANGAGGGTPLDATGLNDWEARIAAGITAAGGGASALTATAVKTANYTAAAGDFVPVDTTSGAVTITLPTAPADKTQVAVKHVIQGSTNAVTIQRGGSTDVFNKTAGATSFTLPLLAQGAILQYKATGGIWYILSDDLALAQLDARYVAVANAAVLDTTASDIQPGVTTGTPVAGATGKAADAGHQHQLPAHDHSTTNKGGTLILLRLPHTYSVSGTLAVPSGGTNFLPPFAVPVPSGKTVKLVAARIWVRSGTATLSINKNGSALSGLSALSITSTPTTFTATGTGSDNTMADMDQIAPVISAVSSSDGLSCTLYFDYSL